MEFTENPAYSGVLDTVPEDEAAAAAAVPVPKPRKSKMERRMAAKTATEEVELLQELPTTQQQPSGGGWYITVWESNYDLEKRVPVDGALGVGLLTVKVVEMIGESVTPCMHHRYE